MSSLRERINQGWGRHAAEPEAVASEAEGWGAEVVDDGEAVALAALLHHVFGEHLGAFARGRAALSAVPTVGPEGAAAVRRALASLSLAQGEDQRAGLSASDGARVTAMAAATLLPFDVARGAALFREAVDQVAALTEGSDPAHRALAVTGNNLACTLEERPARSPVERETMLLAATTARREWAIAGGWMEVERAEYRLSQSYRKAGDAAAARRHAEACLSIVAEHGDPPLERFFGLEALALAARDAGDTEALAQARAEARAAFDALPASDRGWCEASLTALG